jgi:hypothetical protein
MQEHGFRPDFPVRLRCPLGAIATAQAEIDAGRAIVVDDAYYENLKARRAKRRSAKSSEHA